ncbi:WAT1-related protein [Quillaja saponaria]|uniref:WAT1-related protein n=1 Tax=Quillaja saponaria TaxID=32244 RepID=A0AAD7PX99_QUISA|nr:WAT1-related protein [Quillaja saponaria]
MALRHCYKDVLPFSALVTAECTIVGLTILFKLASFKGLNYYVFVAYTYVMATIFLLPFAFINFRRATGLPSLNWFFLGRVFLLGPIGFICQLFSYKGIEYSSPTLASVISNLIPTFTFILAIVFRMEKIAILNSSSQAKIIGTVVSLSGALVVVLYKGPAILSAPSPSNLLHYPLRSSQRDWILGSLLLTFGNILVSVGYVYQTHIIKLYPSELTVVFLYNLSGMIVSVPVCLLVETDLSIWKLRPDISLVAILYSGIFGSVFASSIYAWGIHVKGPVYISSFKPLSIAIAAAMSVIFLGDDLHLGSVVGAIVLSTGFYAFIWGKAKEEDLAKEYVFDRLRTSTNCKTPLLLSIKTEDM